MKKKLVIITPIILIVVFSSFLLINNNNKNEVVMNEKNAPTNNNFLSIMLETEAGSGEYQESTFNGWPGEGYIFNEQMSTCENGSELSWDEELGAVTLSTGIADKCYVYFDVYAPTFAEYIISNVYVEDGVNDLYQHDGVGTYTNADQEAGDNSYRYAGANPNNYVCFGSDVSPCPSDNLYRIIGVFGDEVKVIKSTSYGSYAWDSSDNTWSSSDIASTLNNIYLNSLPITWQTKIATHTWYVGGHTSNEATPKGFYNTESTGTTWSGKIGLMYISDYGFAASSSYWENNVQDYSYNTSNACNNDWLYLGFTEWTISRISSRLSSLSGIAFGVFSGGSVGTLGVSSAFAVRPVFYLTSTTQYVSGSGTSSDPICIN